MPNKLIVNIPFQNNTVAQPFEVTQDVLKRVQGYFVANPEHKSHPVDFIFPELTIPGADAKDSFFEDKDNKTIDQCLKAILNYSRNFPLVGMMIGFPYMVNGKRHISAAYIKDGKIQSIKGKSELANNISSAANGKTASGQGNEYEKRYFDAVQPGIIELNILGQKVNFGAYSGEQDRDAKLFIDETTAPIICEEMFVGTEPGGDMETNRIIQLLRRGVTTFYVHNASPNGNHKQERRPEVLKTILEYIKKLKNTGEITTSLYEISIHYCNYKGAHGLANVFDGASHHAHFENNQPVVKSQLFTDQPHVFDTAAPNVTEDANGEFFLQSNYDKHEALMHKGKPLEYRHTLDNIYPALHTDMEFAYEAFKKHCDKYKGFFVSLSGGFDSSYTLTILALSIETKFREYHKQGGMEAAIRKICAELNITDERHDGLMSQLLSMPQSDENIGAIVNVIRSKLIKAAYIASDLSGKPTREAAQDLANAYGIVCDVVSMADDYIDSLLSYMMPEYCHVDDEQALNAIRSAYKAFLKTSKIASNDQELDSAKQEFKEQLAAYDLTVESDDIINWRQHGLTLENIQARTRAWKNWVLADRANLMPTSNPNHNESIMGYTTFCGDEMAGLASVTSHRQKSHIQLILKYLQVHGVESNPMMTGAVKPVQALDSVFKVPPSAELQPGVEDGLPAQTDEKSYGITYHQLKHIADNLFRPHDNPKNGGAFFNSSELLEKITASRKDDSNPAGDVAFEGIPRIDILRRIADVKGQFLFSRFKRRAMPIGPVTENSIEPHSNLRYPLLGTNDHVDFEINQAFLKELFPDFYEKNETAIVSALLSNKVYAGAVTGARKTLYWKTKELNRISHTDDEFNASLENAVADFKQKQTEMLLTLPQKEQVSEIKSDAETDIMLANIQTVALSHHTNLERIKLAIDKACEQGAKMLVLPEFSLTGHDLDDGVRMLRNEHTKHLLQAIADYAKQRKSDLKVAIGHPWMPETSIIEDNDRSNGYVSAMSVLQHGQVQGMTLRQEAVVRADQSSPEYAFRQMRQDMPANYSVEEAFTPLEGEAYHVIVTTNKDLHELDDNTKLSFYFDAVEHEAQDEDEEIINIHVGGKPPKSDANTLYVSPRGAAAASTCKMGSMTGSSDNFSFKDVNYQKFKLREGGFEQQQDADAMVINDVNQSLKQDALYAYTYLCSAPMRFQLMYKNDVDFHYNLFVVKTAIEQRLNALEGVSLEENANKIATELGVAKSYQHKENTTADEVVYALLNSKFLITDCESEHKPDAYPELNGLDMSKVNIRYHPLNQNVLMRDLGDNPTVDAIRESRSRYAASVTWMIAGKQGTIPVANGTRTDLATNKMTFCGNLHEAPISFSLHRSRSEIADILGLKRDAHVIINGAPYLQDFVDLILDHVRGNAIDALDASAFHNSLEYFNAVKHICYAWHDSALARNSHPMVVETEKSISRQTAYQDPPARQASRHQLIKLALKLQGHEGFEFFNKGCYKELCDKFVGREDVANDVWQALGALVENRISQDATSPAFRAVTAASGSVLGVRPLDGPDPEDEGTIAKKIRLGPDN